VNTSAADSTRFLVGTHTPGGNTGLEAALDLVLSTRFVFSKTSTQPTVETTIDAGLQKITDDYVSQIADQLGPERAWIVIISNEGDILAGSAFTKNKAGSSGLAMRAENVIGFTLKEARNMLNDAGEKLLR